MNLTIVTVFASGHHSTYSKTIPDYDVLHALPPWSPAGRLPARLPTSADIGDTMTLRHMAEKRREQQVEKFIVVRGSLVMEVDPDGMPLK